MTEILGWEDEIEESSFEVMPDGDYHFKVAKFERSWFEPKSADSKIPACNQAEITFEITWKNAKGEPRVNTVIYRLKLVKNLQWLIYQFFESIGLRKKGDGTTKMPWDQMVGKSGICQVGHRESANGNTFNEIVKCYTPESAPNVTQNDTVEPVFAL